METTTVTNPTTVSAPAATSENGTDPKICTIGPSRLALLIGVIFLLVGIVWAIRINRGFWFGLMIIFAMSIVGGMIGHVVSPKTDVKCN